MKKIVLFYEIPIDETLNGLQGNHYKNFVANKKDDLIVERIEVNKYYSTMKDHRIYGEVLDYCYSCSIDYLFFPFFSYPEFLLAELNNRPKFNTKIFISTTYPWWHNYEPRIQVFKELLKKEIIKKILLYTIDIEEFILPDKANYLVDAFPHKIISWVMQEEEKEENYNKRDKRADYALEENDIVGLFFGSMFYGKGIDILAKSLDFIEVHKKIMISSIKEIKNFDFDENIFYNYHNINFLINRFATEEEKYEFFSVSDYIIIPYRKTYEFGSSGIFYQSMIAEKPVIVPDFYPFKKIVEKYKLGLVFETENHKSLAEAIEEMVNNYHDIKQEAKFKDYKLGIRSWNDLINLVTEE